MDTKEILNSRLKATMTGADILRRWADEKEAKLGAIIGDIASLDIVAALEQGLIPEDGSYAWIQDPKLENEGLAVYAGIGSEKGIPLQGGETIQERNISILYRESSRYSAKNAEVPSFSAHSNKDDLNEHLLQKYRELFPSDSQQREMLERANAGWCDEGRETFFEPCFKVARSSITMRQEDMATSRCFYGYQNKWYVWGDSHLIMSNPAARQGAKKSLSHAAEVFTSRVLYPWNLKRNDRQEEQTEIMLQKARDIVASVLPKKIEQGTYEPGTYEKVGTLENSSVDVYAGTMAPSILDVLNGDIKKGDISVSLLFHDTSSAVCAKHLPKKVRDFSTCFGILFPEIERDVFDKWLTWRGAKRPGHDGFSVPVMYGYASPRFDVSEGGLFLCCRFHDMDASLLQMKQESGRQK